MAGSPSSETSPAARVSRPVWATWDWLVDFVFGEVHARPGLDARERELIILSAPIDTGSSDPQVRAHVRALRALGVSFAEIEEAILQTAPSTPAFPGRSTRSRCCATSRRRSREGRTVRLSERRGADRRSRRRVSATQARPARGFVPTPEAWRASWRLTVPSTTRRRQAAPSGRPREDPRDRRQLPLARRRVQLEVPGPHVFAKWASALVGPDEDIVIP